MIKNDFKKKLFSKFSFIFIIFTFLVFLFIFIRFKGEFYYNAINSIPDYINYYISKYLNGDINKFFINGQILIYVENDYQNIFSALYIYIVTFGNIVFKIFSFVFPIFLFHKIVVLLFDEIHKKISTLKIMRIGKKKYFKNTILTNGVMMGLLLVLPKIFYLILLLIFFPVGVSETHFLGYASFISQPYLYVGYGINPIILILIDLLMSFLYGFLISLISTVIVSIVSKKAMSYLLFVFFMGVSSIIAILLKQAPILSYYSIFYYFELITSETLGINVFIPLIIIFIFCIIGYFATKIIFKKSVEKAI